MRWATLPPRLTRLPMGVDPQASPARTRMRAPPRSTEESIAAGCW